MVYSSVADWLVSAIFIHLVGFNVLCLRFLVAVLVDDACSWVCVVAVGRFDVQGSVAALCLVHFPGCLLRLRQ